MVVGGVVKLPEGVLEGTEKLVFPKDAVGLVTTPPPDEVGMPEQMSPTVMVENSVTV